MASNLLGAVGGFLEAFTRSKESKQQREENEKYKKAMTQLLELQIDAASRQTRARSQVGEMSAPRTVNESPGLEQPDDFMGPPEPSGAPVIKPGMSFLDIMSDPEGRIAMLESGMAQQMQQADQLTAQSELVKAMQGSGTPPLEFLQSPEGSALAVRAGMNPSEFLRMQSGGADELIDILQAQIMGGQLQDRAAERGERAAAAAEGRRGLEIELKGSITKARELAQLNDELEGSVLETGQPFGEIYRAAISGAAPLAELVGVDTTQIRDLAGKFQRFNKLASSFTLSLIDQLKINGITDAKLEALRDSTMNVGTSPVANRLAIADALQLALDTADVKGIELPDREGAEELLSSLKGRGVRAATSSVANAAGAAASAVSEGARAAFSALDNLASRAAAGGADLAGRAIEAGAPIARDAASRAGEMAGRGAQAGTAAARDATAKAMAALDSLKDSVSEEDLARAKQFVSRGTEEGALAARAIIDRSLQAGSQAKNVASMTLDQIQQLNLDDVARWTEEQKSALEKRLDELGL